MRQALVGLDRLGSPQGGALQARPDDVYAVQLRLRVDLVLLPRPADLVVGHLDGEVLIHFFAADVAPHPPVEQVLARAGALVSQTGVEADQQALAGKVRAADLGDPVGRAEQAEDDLLLALLAVAVVAARGQWRTAPLQIAGRDIVEQQGGGLRGQAASGGELGAGLEYAGDYGGSGPVRLVGAVLATENYLVLPSRGPAR